MCLAAVAGLAAAEGQPDSAARLFGAAECARQTVGITMDGADRVAHDAYVALVRSQLDEQAFASAWAEGRGMNLDQAANDALTMLAQDGTT